MQAFFKGTTTKEVIAITESPQMKGWASLWASTKSMTRLNTRQVPQSLSREPACRCPSRAPTVWWLPARRLRREGGQIKRPEAARGQRQELAGTASSQRFHIAVITARFGELAKLIAAGEYLQHWLNIAQGLTVLLDAKGRDVLQCAAPNRGPVSPWP